jgi:hypothetical protein
MRTLHRLPIGILLLTLSVAAAGCSGGTPTASASAAQEPAQHGEFAMPGTGDAFPQENNTAADTGSAARGGGATFGSGN